MSICKTNKSKQTSKQTKKRTKTKNKYNKQNK